MNRIVDRKSGNAVLVPLDHGVTMGPINGLSHLGDIVDSVCEGGATGVIIHKGMVRSIDDNASIGMVVHLSASTNPCPVRNTKALVSSVENALRLGADAVSMHINFGSENEFNMLSDFGEVSDSCHSWGVPLLAMAYTTGLNADSFSVDNVAHVARAVAELGADMVKCNYTGPIDSFKKVVDSCPVPIVIAGGPKMNSDEELLKMVHESMIAGGSGVSIGRNIFQNSNVVNITRAISSIVTGGMGVEEASRLL